MRWLSVFLPGAFEDALLYAGRLVTLGRDGTLSVVAWGRLVDALSAGDGVVTALLARNDALDGERAGLLRQALRPAVALLAGRRLEASLEPFVASRSEAEPWSDAAVYRRRLYVCRPDGVWRAPFDPDDRAALGEARRISDAPALRVRPAAHAVAVADAEGLALLGESSSLRVTGLAPERIDWHGPTALVAVPAGGVPTLLRVGRKDGGQPALRGAAPLETPAEPPDHVFGADGELWAGAGRTLWRLALDARSGTAVPRDRMELADGLGDRIEGTVTAFGAVVETETDLVWAAADGVSVEPSLGRVRAFPHSAWYRRLALVRGPEGIEVRCHLDDLLAEGGVWSAGSGRRPFRSRSGR